MTTNPLPVHDDSSHTLSCLYGHKHFPYFCSLWGSCTTIFSISQMVESPLLYGEASYSLSTTCSTWTFPLPTKVPIRSQTFSHLSGPLGGNDSLHLRNKSWVTSGSPHVSPRGRHQSPPNKLQYPVISPIYHNPHTVTKFFPTPWGCGSHLISTSPTEKMGHKQLLHGEQTNFPQTTCNICS